MAGVGGIALEQNGHGRRNINREMGDGFQSLSPVRINRAGAGLVQIGIGALRRPVTHTLLTCLYAHACRRRNSPNGNTPARLDRQSLEKLTAKATFFIVVNPAFRARSSVAVKVNRRGQLAGGPIADHVWLRARRYKPMR